MLGGLGGDAAKLLGLERGDEPLADLIALAHPLRILQADLGVRVFHLFDNLLRKAGAEDAERRVDIDDDVLILDLVVLLDRDDDRRLDLVDQVIGGQAALLFQRRQGFEEFVVGCCSSHFCGFLPNL